MDIPALALSFLRWDVMHVNIRGYENSSEAASLEEHLERMPAIRARQRLLSRSGACSLSTTSPSQLAGDSAHEHAPSGPSAPDLSTWISNLQSVQMSTPKALISLHDTVLTHSLFDCSCDALG